MVKICKAETTRSSYKENDAKTEVISQLAVAFLRHLAGGQINIEQPIIRGEEENMSRQPHNTRFGRRRQGVPSRAECSVLVSTHHPHPGPRAEPITRFHPPVCESRIFPVCSSRTRGQWGIP